VCVRACVRACVHEFTSRVVSLRCQAIERNSANCIRFHFSSEIERNPKCNGMSFPRSIDCVPPTKLLVAFQAFSVSQPEPELEECFRFAPLCARFNLTRFKLPHILHHITKRRHRDQAHLRFFFSVLVTHIIFRGHEAMSVFVVTGASRGIGLEIVRTLERNPSIRAVIGTRRNGISRPLAESGYSEALLDVSDSQSPRDLASELARVFPNGIDVLINNAGASSKGSEVNERIAAATFDVSSTLHTHICARCMRIQSAFLTANRRMYSASVA
jgi:hypothetical protein